MKKIILPAILCLCLLAVGCDNKAPGCSDAETKDLVVQIAQGEAVKQFGKEQADTISFRVEAIRTKEVNKETGSCYCAADLIMTGPNGSTKIPIEYTSELTDKGDEFYVTVDGL